MNRSEFPHLVPSLVTRCGLCWLAFTALTVAAGDWPQWRGPNRNGNGAETGLLAEWPKEGPKLVWKASAVGTGYSSPAVTGGRVYLIGNEGLEDESVRALSAADGKPVWSTRLGKVGNPDQKPNFPGARSTPTVQGDLLYALGSDGDLVCVSTLDGKVQWRKQLRTDFGGKPGQWAYSESPLIDGDLVICTPGGAESTILALHRKTGEVAWKTALPEADQASYSSAILVEKAGVRQVVQSLQKGLVGVDAKTGKFLWRYARAVSRYGANIPTPFENDGKIFAAGAGTGAGLVKLKGQEGSVTVEEQYFESKLPTAIGGILKVGDLAFGTTAQALMCFDFNTGQLKWEERAIGAASMCLVDGRLILHGENGEVALIQPSAEKYIEKGRFTPMDSPKKSNGMEKSWAYPAVADGKLYVRDHGVLWCYALK